MSMDNRPNSKFRIMQLAQKLAASANQPEEMKKELEADMAELVRKYREHSPEVEELEIRKMFGFQADETEE